MKTGDRLFLNDGIIHLQVVDAEGSEVHCQVLVGGELRSRKGLILPGINLGVSAFTDNDHDCLKVELTMRRITPVALIVPTLSGATARNITRFRLPVWITAYTPVSSTSQALQFSYGINPVVVERNLKDWNLISREWLKTEAFDSGLALLVQGPSGEHPEQNHRLEILELG